MIRMNGNGAPSLEAQMLYRQGVEMACKGRYDAAVSILAKAVMIAPCFARAYNEMGNCLDRMGRYPEAREAFKKVFEINPEYEGISLKMDALARKIESSRSGGPRPPDKIHHARRGEKDEDHPFMDDRAAISGIPQKRPIINLCT